MLRVLRSCLRAVAAVSFILASVAFSPDVSDARGGATYVRGYVRHDGTYVQPHMRSAPDGNFQNNWSTRGNVNPYTGVAGTKTSPPPSYGQDVYVNGYFRSDGTYVPAHYRSAPDGDPTNNWSTQGNVNPYTGQVGTRSVVDETSDDSADLENDSADSDLGLGASAEDDSDDPGVTDGADDSEDSSGGVYAPTYTAPAIPLVLALQEALLVAGESPGPLDGVLGPKTVSAFRHYRSQNSLNGLPLELALERLSVGAREVIPDAATSLHGYALRVAGAH